MNSGTNHKGDSFNSSFSDDCINDISDDGGSSKSTAKNSCGSIEADKNRIILNASEQKVRLKLVMVMLQNYSEIFRLKNEINSYRDTFKDI